MSIDENSKAVQAALQYACFGTGLTKKQALELLEAYEAAKTEQAVGCAKAFEQNYDAAYDFDKHTFANGMFYRIGSSQYQNEINRDWIAFQKGWKACPKRESGCPRRVIDKAKEALLRAKVSMSTVTEMLPGAGAPDAPWQKTIALISEAFAELALITDIEGGS